MSEQGDLRREFDDSFARAAATPRPHVALLSISVAGASYVVLLDEIHSVTRAGIITPAPSARRELVGITAVRGKIVAVLDLAMLLGHPRASAAPWLVLVKGHAVAVAVDRVDGYLTVPRVALAGDSVAIDGGLRAVVPLATLVSRLVEKEQ
jgi:chemotaxis signal transduction protein